MAAIPLIQIGCEQKEGVSEENTFEFSFLTDIHIKPEMNAPKGFQMAIDKVNDLNPDFVITVESFTEIVFECFSSNVISKSRSRILSVQLS